MSNIKQYRKKPVVIEAAQLDNDWSNVKEIATWCGGTWVGSIGKGIVIETLEGNITASQGDYIIKGVKGEFYPCKPDIFDATYEPVQATTPKGGEDE